MIDASTCRRGMSRPRTADRGVGQMSGAFGGQTARGLHLQCQQNNGPPLQEKSTCKAYAAGDCAIFGLDFWRGLTKSSGSTILGMALIWSVACGMQGQTIPVLTKRPRDAGQSGHHKCDQARSAPLQCCEVAP